MNPNEPERLLVSARNAARMLGISTRTLWTLTRCGGIPCVRIGARVLYSADTLRKWIATREAQGVAR
jgi:excisionase family DNA binding protein